MFVIRQKKKHQKNCWSCECSQCSLGYKGWKFPWSLREVDAKLPSISRKNDGSASLGSAGKSSLVIQESFSIRKVEVTGCSGTNTFCSAWLHALHMCPLLPLSCALASSDSPTRTNLSNISFGPLWSFYPISTHKLTEGVSSGLPRGTGTCWEPPCCPPAQLCAATSSSLTVPGFQLGYSPLVMKINLTHCQCILKGMRMLSHLTIFSCGPKLMLQSHTSHKP